ncbi:hypothetical protein [Alysiella crassa]|uniref:Uncharacterized protein n=1 Tax=Alysiella crassa TaxID=153491 RepID=A0A376BTY5_9NEIS|nr:hypothetical protein [Alysiella crassa]UOP05883.1 hypothetical protein LVJ80_08310 [Alysiella crassa]SSY80311.1 Uncharacterised protein [Alysiella crassa]
MYLIEKGDVVRHIRLGKLMLVLADENDKNEVELRDLSGLEYVEPSFDLVKCWQNDPDVQAFIQKMNDLQPEKENSNEH